MPELELLSIVALLEDMPQDTLRRGQVGTVIEAFSAGVYEIEFSDDFGRTYASVAVKSKLLLPLFHKPAEKAASSSQS